MSKTSLHTIHTPHGLGWILCGLVVLTTLIVWAIHDDKIQSQESPVEEVVRVEDTSVAQVIQVESVLAKSLPVRLRIPALAIDTGFVAPLGLLGSGEVEVPESNTEVGWYKYSPTPGELGPAVIFGHVDSYTGPAVFFSLGQLDPGDDIYVEREDGTEAHFVVTGLERYQQSEFPTALVYGDIDHAGLRLITCSGLYNRGSGRYSHNLVVYAALKE